MIRGVSATMMDGPDIFTNLGFNVEKKDIQFLTYSKEILKERRFMMAEYRPSGVVIPDNFCGKQYIHDIINADLVDGLFTQIVNEANSRKTQFYGGLLFMMGIQAVNKESGLENIVRCMASKYPQFNHFLDTGKTKYMRIGSAIDEDKTGYPNGTSLNKIIMDAKLRWSSHSTLSIVYSNRMELGGADLTLFKEEFDTTFTVFDDYIEANITSDLLIPGESITKKLMVNDSFWVRLKENLSLVTVSKKSDGKMAIKMDKYDDRQLLDDQENQITTQIINIPRGVTFSGKFILLPNPLTNVVALSTTRNIQDLVQALLRGNMYNTYYKSLPYIQVRDSNHSYFFFFIHYLIFFHLFCRCVLLINWMIYLKPFSQPRRPCLTRSIFLQNSGNFVRNTSTS
jgi:hypothetical protein